VRVLGLPEVLREALRQVSPEGQLEVHALLYEGVRGVQGVGRGVQVCVFGLLEALRPALHGACRRPRLEVLAM
jgi:hypothetical protein